MALHLYNTLTRQKEEFKPIDAKNVRLYACGPTVYNFAHIGNAKPAVIFDFLARVLEHIYGADHVSYTRNITDIDDKIIEAAKKDNVPISVITEKYTRIYNEDMGALGVRPLKPGHQPRATEYVPHMVKMISDLINNGNAYAAEGHVLFHVPSWPDYGRLSRRNRDDMIAGARVEVAPYKKDPADFVLWKPSTPDQPGWDSPWGRGRPGWHIECSAMNAAINGETFDIHAGGEDLIFPHHENEIAQSVCAHKKPYVNYWLHVGFVNMDNEKMSKSLGNVRLVHDLVKEFKPEALRLVLLSGHYRQPLNFTREAVGQAVNTLDRYYGLLRDVKNIKASLPPAEFLAALKDDLNTPKALAVLSQLAKDGDIAAIKASGAIMGILQQDPEDWFKGGGEDAGDIERQIETLKAARADKDYKTADAIRDLLKSQYQVTVSITAAGITWRKE